MAPNKRMMNKDVTDQGEKFLFNLHIFDTEDDPAQPQEDIAEDTPEEDLPPPPIFTQEELTTAEEKAFERGRAEGHKAALEESQNSRAQKTADLIRVISQSMTPLLETEFQREKTYEVEAVSLTLSIFTKIFPIYAQAHQFSELQESIQSILRQQEGQKHIAVAVNPQDEKALKEQLEDSDQSALSHIIVRGDDKLPEGACTLSWDDGGAVKDTTDLGEKIKALLVQTLEGHGIKSHDEEEGLSNTSETVHNGGDEAGESDTGAPISAEEADHASGTPGDTNRDNKENHMLTEKTDE